MEKLLRKLPSVDRVLSRLSNSLKGLPKDVLKEFVREDLEERRRKIKEKRFFDGISDIKSVVLSVEKKAKEFFSPSLRPVINGTGVVVHTNLGRSILPKEAIEQIVNISQNYSNLEFDLEKGERGSRYTHVERLLKRLCDAEACLVVNNNAAAVFLMLNTLAFNKEVIVSRGELVEIGGSFRIPEIMERSGAILKEVGTTNRTRLSDYEGAICENTAMILKVHRSNFQILGFTEEVDREDLSGLAKKFGLIYAEDLGSGLVVDLGLSEKEPTVSEVLKKGADIVTFSGDKLLGSTQAGIILGKKDLIGRIKKNPLNRVVRIDKLTLAGLEATLRIYIKGEAKSKIPTISLISQNLAEIEEKAVELFNLAKDIEGLEIKIVDTFSEIGGGAFPILKLPSKALSIGPKNGSIEHLARSLRKANPPIIGRIFEEKFLLDLRTIFREDFEKIVYTLKNIANKEI